MLQYFKQLKIRGLIPRRASFFCTIPENKEDKKNDSNKQTQKKKISNAQFLKFELTQNPEFDKAFPHLAAFKPPTTVQRDLKEQDFMKTLEYHYRVPEPRSLETSLMKNQKKFYEGYLSPKGPKKYMSQEEKDKVHLEIDVRLQELEDTGLSKEEILYDGKTGGVPLGSDPFFQLIKNNRIAREMLIESGEEFSANRVVDLALRQDLDPDPSMARRKRDYLYKYQMNDQRIISQAKKTLGDRLMFDPTSYEADYLDVKGHSNQIDHKDDEQMQVYVPLSRGQLRRKVKRTINPLDIHWRNTELLTTFLNHGGKIKSRFQNRLPLWQQKKVIKIIKHARTLLLLPYTGYVRSYHKKSLTSLQEDIEDFSRRVINLETGQIYIKPKDSDVKVENALKIEDPLKFDKEKYGQLKDLEFEYMPLMPTTQEATILEAQQYAALLKEKQLKNEGIDVKNLKKKKFNEANFEETLEIEEEDPAKIQKIETFSKSFEELGEKISKVTVNNFLHSFVSEKAVSPKMIDKLSTKCAVNKIPKTKQEILDDINKLKAELGLQKIKFDQN